MGFILDDPEVHFGVGDVFCSPCRYDTYKLQRLHQKKLDRQEAMVEKEMFVGKVVHSVQGKLLASK